MGAELANVPRSACLEDLFASIEILSQTTALVQHSPSIAFAEAHGAARKIVEAADNELMHTHHSEEDWQWLASLQMPDDVTAMKPADAAAMSAQAKNEQALEHINLALQRISKLKTYLADELQKHERSRAKCVMSEIVRACSHMMDHIDYDIIPSREK